MHNASKNRIDGLKRRVEEECDGEMF
jgi:hypothetical protein